MQVELQLFRLFYNERNIAEAREKIDIRQKEHDKVDKKKDKLEDNVRDVKKNAGKKTRDEVITEFMAQWETDKADGTVTRDEFLDYYKGACGCRAGVMLAPPRMCVRMSVLPSAPFASAVFALCGA